MAVNALQYDILCKWHFLKPLQTQVSDSITSVVSEALRRAVSEGRLTHAEALAQSKRNAVLAMHALVFCADANITTLLLWQCCRTYTNHPGFFKHLRTHSLSSLCVAALVGLPGGRPINACAENVGRVIRHLQKEDGRELPMRAHTGVVNLLMAAYRRCEEGSKARTLAQSHRLALLAGQQRLDTALRAATGITDLPPLESVPSPLTPLIPSRVRTLVEECHAHVVSSASAAHQVTVAHPPVSLPASTFTVSAISGRGGMHDFPPLARIATVKAVLSHAIGEPYQVLAAAVKKAATPLAPECAVKCIHTADNQFHWEDHCLFGNAPWAVVQAACEAPDLHLVPSSAASTLDMLLQHVFSCIHAHLSEAEADSASEDAVAHPPAPVVDDRRMSSSVHKMLMEQRRAVVLDHVYATRVIPIAPPLVPLPPFANLMYRGGGKRATADRMATRDPHEHALPLTGEALARIEAALTHPLARRLVFAGPIARKSHHTAKRGPGRPRNIGVRNEERSSTAAFLAVSALAAPIDDGQYYLPRGRRTSWSCSNCV